MKKLRSISVAKKTSSYKVFNGRKYYFQDWTMSKKEAKELAELFRLNKFLARVIKEKSSGQYHIYIS